MSIRMKKKILLAGGCSYTDENFYSIAHKLPDDERGGWPMWPEIMGKELGLEVFNTASSGCGNPEIAKTIISNIIKYGDRIEKVVVLWTSADRIQHYNYTVHPLIDAYGNEPLATENSVYFGLNELKWEPWFFQENRVVENWFRDSLLAMYTVATLCKSKGIDFIFGQGVNFHLHAMTDVTREMVEKLNKDNPSVEYDNILENITQHTELDFISIIEKGSFGGTNAPVHSEVEYPIYKELKKKYRKNLMYNGYEIHEFESALDFVFHLERGVYRISDNRADPIMPFDYSKHDYHPNSLGQKYIADTFISHYKIM